VERYNRIVRHEWLDQSSLEALRGRSIRQRNDYGLITMTDPNMGIGSITPVMKLKMAG